MPRRTAYQLAANTLFAEWRNVPEHDAASFITDGVLAWEQWEKQPLRVMFLVKEAYSNEEDGAGFDWAEMMLKDNFPYGTFWQATRWLEAIRCGYADRALPTYDDVPSQSDAHCLFRGIAWVNLKKSKGEPISNYSDLQGYVDRDRMLLIRQLDLIQPDLIVGNNVLNFYRALYPEEEIAELGTDDWVYQHGSRVFLNCYHFAYRRSRQHYNDLIKALPRALAAVKQAQTSSAARSHHGQSDG